MKNDLLRKAVRALIKEEYTQVAPGGEETLGKIVFSKNRLDDVPKDEEDTPIERELYSALEQYVNENEPLPDHHTNQIKDILQSGNYSKLFKEPPGGVVVYRGMSVNSDWLSDALKLPKEKIPKSGEKEGSFAYTHYKGEASSWTLSEEETKRFTNRFSQWGVVIHARTSENKLKFLDLSGIYNVDPMYSMKREEECIGLGPIEAFKFSWFKKKL